MLSGRLHTAAFCCRGQVKLLYGTSCSLCPDVALAASIMLRMAVMRRRYVSHKALQDSPTLFTRSRKAELLPAQRRANVTRMCKCFKEMAGVTPCLECAERTALSRQPVACPKQKSLPATKPGVRTCQNGGKRVYKCLVRISLLLRVQPMGTAAFGAAGGGSQRS